MPWLHEQHTTQDMDKSTRNGATKVGLKVPNAFPTPTGQYLMCNRARCLWLAAMHFQPFACSLCKALVSAANNQLNAPTAPQLMYMLP
jgi:hypothetical protein